MQDPIAVTRPAGRASRRHFIGTSLSGLAAVAGASRRVFAAAGRGVSAPPQAAQVIDTHTHFYDPTRPHGVPWPPKDDAVLYRTVLPKDYQALPKPQPVTGTVVVEASEWVEDNQWILDLAAREPFIVGFVGQLPVGTPEFRSLLTRFAANEIFRGVRVRADKLKAGWGQARFLADLKLLAERDLSLDVVGGADVLALVPEMAEKVPALRIIIDHFAGVRIDGKAPDAAWQLAMSRAAKHPNVFCKVSGLVEGSGRRGNQAPRELAFYKPVLDVVWNLFGEDRLLYGSNWPVCEHYADLATVQRIVTEYFAPKGAVALDKVFAQTARRAYKWVRRGGPRRL